MKKCFLHLFLVLLSLDIAGQNCSILSKANDITPDKLCSPVTATWHVLYTGVNDEGTPVSIRFDWDNGKVVTVPATEVRKGVFEAVATNTYTSAGNRCNYHPRATLVVNGVRCTSSTQEQIVTVWDDDDHNGGDMRINPVIWPICFGSGDNARFQDLTRFNCVPPAERDNPNVNTRWVQWIYGTANTMTGIPVKINDHNRNFPFSGDIITLRGPVTGSGVWSEIINVASDKAIGQYFEVTLRNWNYCNPYDDPAIQGPPRDKENGDHPPVVTTARILIVPYPDATINPVPPVCEDVPAFTLTAHDPGGRWIGPGITGSTFNPSDAGPGKHLIEYRITNPNGCSDHDTAFIVVKPLPSAEILTKGIFCVTDPPVTLVAADVLGTWTGTGVSGNVFSPSVAGFGNHTITYMITVNGCSSSSQTVLTVATPDATITPVDTLCVNSPPVVLHAHDLGGVWQGNGVSGDTFYPSVAGAGNHLISYDLNNTGCNDTDTVIIVVMPVPVVTIKPVGTVYLNTPPFKLEAKPQGGIFSGTGIRDTVFDPRFAGEGTHIITYETLTDRFGCSALDTIHIRVTYPPVPQAYWLPDTSGCNPLTVQFRNKSKTGDTYIWDFGDKTYSVEKNPVHTYFVPGNYIVRLTVTNLAGSSYHQGIIVVFQQPAAIFAAYPTNVTNNNQIVIFTNHSYFGESYLWNFGDSTSSSDVNPYHKYEKPGSYTVKLFAVSADGCVDSAFLNTPVVVDWKTGDINFANVFKWNESGPTGGIWREGAHSDMDKVFRPFFENVIEYKLQIFSRWGVLIYESDDLAKGWDGYRDDGTLAPQGVYVWKVTGRFADGDYFTRIGDVTFLH
jgi:hypothetical protein